MRFFFFSLEENRMHIHIRQAEKKAKIWIEPSISLAENKGFSSTEISNILKEVQNMSVLLEKNGTTTAEVTMINARGILLFVGGKEYYLSYDRYPWFRNAKVSDVLDVTMPDEESLRWDAIDVDLEIDSIIHPERYPISF